MAATRGDKNIFPSWETETWFIHCTVSTLTVVVPCLTKSNLSVSHSPGHVHNSPSGPRSPIIDGRYNVLAVFRVCNFDFRAARQASMCCRQFRRHVRSSAGGFVAFQCAAVERSCSFLSVGIGRPGLLLRGNSNRDKRRRCGHNRQTPGDYDNRQ